MGVATISRCCMRSSLRSIAKSPSTPIRPTPPPPPRKPSGSGEASVRTSPIFSWRRRGHLASRRATWGVTSTASTASPPRRPATPGPRPMSRTWAGSALIQPMASPLPTPMCGWRYVLPRRVSRFRIKGDALPKGYPHRYNLVAGSSEKSKKQMTYCCGILVQAGLVMVADTRTNAGLDNISTFRKLHVYTQPGERIMALASSGNLSLSQSVRSTLTEGVQNPETGEVETLMNAPTMFQAAQRIGRTIRQLQIAEGKVLEAAEVDHEVAFLFGGQIKGERLRLFMIYSAGNFIECTTDTPYLQIGEHKYGKPVLDRAVGYGMDLYDALKIGLISMDSTMRSNLGVGLPIDILVVRRDACTAEVNYRIEPGEPYFQDLRERWSSALRAAHIAIPRPPYRSSN